MYQVFVSNEGNTPITADMPTDALGDTYEGTVPATILPGQRYPSFAASRELPEGEYNLENQALVTAAPVAKHSQPFTTPSNTVTTLMRR